MNKNLITWLLYDAGNSFLVAALGGLYLAQWVVLDNGFEDIWYGGVLALATVLVLLASPFLGAWSDKIKRRLPFLKWLTLLLFFFNILLVIFANINLASKTRVYFVLLLFLLIQFFYQLSLIFYNTLIERISTEKNRGKIAGLGEAFGNGGWIVGTALLLPFALNKIHLIGQPGRTQVFLPAFILFLILTLPLLIWFREKSNSDKHIKESQEGSLPSFKVVYNKTISGFKELFKENKNVAWFLLGFCFVSDAILTINQYFAIVMDKLYKITDTQKFLITALMFFFTIISSYLLGKAGDKYGMKKILVLSCLVLIFILSLAFISSAYWFLYFLAFFAGIGWAGFYVASRALLVKISPPERLGEYFGFYSTFQRFASIVGPLVWGVVVLAGRNLGPAKYRIAGFSLILLMAVGVFLFKLMKEKRVVV